MIKIISSFFLMFFLLGANFSVAAPVDTATTASVTAPVNSVNTSLDIAVKDTTAKLQLIAVKWLSAFILLQFFITNFGALKSGGDIDSIIYKVIGSFAWFGICFYVMENGSKFLSDVSSGFFVTASEITGGGGKFDTADILNKGCASAADLIQQVTSAASYISLIPAAILAGLLGLVILGVAATIAFKLFLIKVEVMLLIMMAPLSFAFLGLNSMKDQGIAPFKSLISLTYRIIILAVIMSAMASVGKNLDLVIANVNKESFISGMWQSLFGATVAFALLGFLAYKSDAMAANLSSGGTSLGTGDAGVAAAMGGAMGGAIGAALTGSTGAITGLTGKAQPMSDFIKNMVSGGGASDASGGRGAGGTGPVGQAPAKPANMSTNGPAGDAKGAPKPPEATGGSQDAQPPAEIATGMTTPPSGSGATAGIGGAGRLEENLSKLVDQMTKQNDPKKTTLGDHLRNVNQNAQQERNVVSVSISAHHGE